MSSTKDEFSGGNFMVRLHLPTLLSALATANPCVAGDPNADGRPLILANYMPWYVAKPYSTVWGLHWTMNAFDPEKVSNGKRQIASHYARHDRLDDAALDLRSQFRRSVSRTLAGHGLCLPHFDETIIALWVAFDRGRTVGK
jgi:hypothetical protein